MRTKPKVGQKLYSLNVGNALRRHGEQKLTPGIVTKVGRKYFYVKLENSCDWKTGKQYHLNNWREKTEHCVNSELYESEQGWFDKKESGEIRERMRREFAAYGRVVTKIPLEKLREMDRILQSCKEEQGQ